MKCGFFKEGKEDTCSFAGTMQCHVLITLLVPVKVESCIDHDQKTKENLMKQSNLFSAPFPEGHIDRQRRKE